MKIKNIKLSSVVLVMLIIGSFAFFVSAQEQSTTAKNIFLDSDQDGLSDAEEKTYGTNPQVADTDGDGYSDGAEVKSGYDPLKKSPGDKLIPELQAPKSSPASDPSKPNLTAELAQKISDIIVNAGADNQNITLDQVQDLIADAANAEVAPDELPKITIDNIKIKKQDYGNLSAEKSEAKKKEDFTSYIAGLSYVFSSNSPTPITSDTDISKLSSSFTTQMVAAITTGNLSSAQEIIASEEKILQQMQGLEVPEDLVDLHIKGLQLAEYASEMKEKIMPNENDPVSTITNYSKIQNLIDLMSAYAGDVQAKFSQYGLAYDDAIQGKLKDFGVDIPAALL